MNIQITELMNLLNRASAALDDPKSITQLELEELSEDCQVMSDLLEEAATSYIELVDD